MRLPRPPRGGRDSFNMTPMIDVVFLLIVFFLVSSHLAKHENRFPLPLPDASTGLEPHDRSIERVTVNVMEDGSLLLAGKLLTIDELQPRLEHEQGERKGQLKVRLRGHRNATYQTISPVLGSCARAGIWDIQVAVLQPSRDQP